MTGCYAKNVTQHTEQFTASRTRLFNINSKARRWTQSLAISIHIPSHQLMSMRHISDSRNLLFLSSKQLTRVKLIALSNGPNRIVVSIKLNITKRTKNNQLPLKIRNPDTNHSASRPKKKPSGFSLQANYTDRATAACRRS
jgi:hypothetical protein